MHWVGVVEQGVTETESQREIPLVGLEKQRRTAQTVLFITNQGLVRL